MRKFDFLSPPSLFGGMYLYLFGLGAIDAALYQNTDVYRVWRYFSAWHGISLDALKYIWFGFALFSVGYYLPIGRVIAILPRKIIGAFTFDETRSFVVPAALFVAAIYVQIWLSQRFYFSRIPGLSSTRGQLTSDISFLAIVGDLVSMAYAFSIWRFMLSRRPDGSKMSIAAKWFLFGVIVPLLAASLILTASRSKIAFVMFATLLAYHYGYRRVRARTVVIAGLMVLAVISPMIALLRAPKEEKQSIVSLVAMASYSWEVVFRRTTSLEGFTVTFENLESAPEPDPLWLLVGSTVPRVLWQDKPFGTLMERFSIWASGRAETMLTPSLPGELLLHFSFAGSLAAMFFLGILWRFALVTLIGSENRPSATGFIYILILPVSLQAIENGFVLEYGALLRSLMVGLIVFGLASRPRTRSARMAIPENHGMVVKVKK